MLTEFWKLIGCVVGQGLFCIQEAPERNKRHFLQISVTQAMKQASVGDGTLWGMGRRYQLVDSSGKKTEWDVSVTCQGVPWSTTHYS